MGALDAGIQVEPDTRDGEHNLSWQLADRLIPTKCPSLFAPNPGHHHVSAASGQAEAGRSAVQLLMLASGTEQRVNTLATQFDPPGRSHSPSDPRTRKVYVHIPAAGEDRRELSRPAVSPTYSSAYSIPCKFQLRLPGFSSILLARSATVPAETGVGSPLTSVSVLGHLLSEQSSPAPTNVANVWLAEGEDPFQAIYNTRPRWTLQLFPLVFSHLFLEFMLFSLFPDYFCFRLAHYIRAACPEQYT